MPRLIEIYVAARTRNVEDADTEDLPILALNRGGVDVAQLPLQGNDLGTGKSEIYRIDVAGQGIDSEDLSVRLLASGNDAWSPEHILVWGIAGERPRELVIPMAVGIDLATPMTPRDEGIWLSTDTSEGVNTVFLRVVGPGRRRAIARRLVVIVATDPYPNMFPASPGPVGVGHDYEDRGTDGPLTLQAGGAGKLLLSYTLPQTPQGDLQHTNAGFYVPDLAAPFSRADTAGGAFTLTLGSEDYWMPDYFAVFGLDTSFGDPNVLIPFVAAPAFVLPQMSTDPSEGWHTVVLPSALVIEPGLVQPPVVNGELVSVMAARAGRGKPHPARPEGVSERAAE